VHRAVDQAVEQNDLRLFRHPEVPKAEVPLKKGEDLRLELELMLRPDIELRNYRGLRVANQLKPVTDEDVDQAIADWRRSNPRAEPAGEKGMAEDGMALAKLELLHGNEVVLEREGLRLTAESTPTGVDPEAYRKALAGAAEGAVIEFALPLPKGLERPELEGQSGTCRFTLKQVFKLVPASLEEMCSSISVADEPALRAEVRRQLEEMRRREEEMRRDEEVIGQIVAGHDFELPESLIAEQVHNRMTQLEERLRSAGAPEEQVQAELLAQREGARTASERSGKAFFLMEAIAQKEGLLVTEEDLRKEFGAIASRNQVPVKQVAEYYKEHRLTGQLVMEILDRKVRSFLRDVNPPLET
jgi:trigger factor